MTTSDTSPPNDSEQMEFFQTSSWEVSHARPTRSQENDLPAQTSATSGLTSLDSFARLSPDGSWQKMSRGFTQANLDGSLEEFCETWPVQGMMRSGVAYPLKTLEPHTSASASGLWPTPRSAMTGDIVPARMNDTNNNLERALAREMFRTPSRQEAGQSAAFLASLVTKDGQPARPGERAYNPATGQLVQMTLNRTVKMFPTPNATDWKGPSQPNGRRPICDDDLPSRVARERFPTPTREDGESKGMSAARLATRKPDNLATKVRLEASERFPTPRSVDASNVALLPTQNKDRKRSSMMHEGLARAVMLPSPAARDWRSGKRRSENGHTPQLPEVTGGQLSAGFVEWMFGLPKDWTKVDPESGTPNGRASRASSPRKPKRSTGANG